MPTPPRRPPLDADAVLRELYSPDRIQDVLFRQSPLLGMLERSSQEDIARQQQAMSQRFQQAQLSNQPNLANQQMEPFLNGYNGLPTADRLPMAEPLDELSRLVDQGVVSREQAMWFLERRVEHGLSAMMGGSSPAPANNRHDRKREEKVPVRRVSRWELISQDWFD